MLGKMSVQGCPVECGTVTGLAATDFEGAEAFEAFFEAVTLVVFFAVAMVLVVGVVTSPRVRQRCAFYEWAPHD